MDPDDLAVTVAAGIDPALADVVGGILRDKDLPHILAGLGGTARVTVEAQLEDGTPLADAHENWQPEALAGLQGVPPFGRQSPDAITPPGLVRVACECVHEASGGMSSHYGFRGYFVSLLVSVPARAIWDARMEEAR